MSMIDSAEARRIEFQRLQHRHADSFSALYGYYNGVGSIKLFPRERELMLQELMDITWAKFFEMNPKGPCEEVLCVIRDGANPPPESFFQCLIRDYVRFSTETQASVILIWSKFSESADVFLSPKYLPGLAEIVRQEDLQANLIGNHGELIVDLLSRMVSKLKNRFKVQKIA